MQSILKRSQYLPYILIGLMCMFVMRDIGGIYINPYAITILLSIIAVFLPYDKLIAYSCFLLPLSCGIQSFIWVVIIGCIFFKTRHISRRTVILFILFSILEILDQSLAFGIDINAKISIFYLVSLLVVLSLIFDSNKPMDYAQNIRYFIYGSCFILVVIIIRIILEYGMAEMLTGAIRYKLDDTTISGDYVFFTNANNLGLYASVCFTTLIYMGRNNLKMSHPLFIISLLLVLLGGMFTFSRTWLILTTFSFFSYIFLSRKNKSYLLILSFFILFIYVALVSSYFDPIVEVFEMRLTDEDMKDGAGRTDLFSSYNQFFLENPKYWLTGTGAVYYRDICNQPNSIHNMLQQFYICYGFLGVLGLLILTLGIYKDYKIFSPKLIQLVPLFIYFIFVQTVQFFNPIFCMYPLIMCVYCLKVHTNESR